MSDQTYQEAAANIHDETRGHFHHGPGHVTAEFCCGGHNFSVTYEVRTPDEEGPAPATQPGGDRPRTGGA